MIKTKVVLEVKKEERVYQFFTDPSSALGEIFDVLTEMRQEIANRIQSVDKKAEKKEEGECNVQS